MSLVLAQHPRPARGRCCAGCSFGIQHASRDCPWAWSIIVLTVCVRLAILPLAIVQMRSMRGMQKIAPELQKLKQKHKGDSQKLQQEMMLLYKEHGVNPIGSCLPLLFQLPGLHGPVLRAARLLAQASVGRPELPRRLHPEHRRARRQRGLGGLGADRRLRAEPAGLDAAHADRRRSAAADDAAAVHGHAVHLRLLRDPLPRRADALLDLHQPLDGRAAGGAAQAHGPAAERRAAQGQEASAPRASPSRAAARDCRAPGARGSADGRRAALVRGRGRRRRRGRGPAGGAARAAGAGRRRSPRRTSSSSP